MNTHKCGYAHVKDVTTSELEDAMESYFLAETMKYLYLLFSNCTSLVDFYVFTTEAHLLAPFLHTSDEEFPDQATVPENCASICTEFQDNVKVCELESSPIKFAIVIHLGIY